MTTSNFKTQKEKILGKIKTITGKGSIQYKKGINHSSRNHKILMGVVGVIILIFAVLFIEKARKPPEHIAPEIEIVETIPLNRDDLDRALRFQMMNKENKEVEELKRQIGHLETLVKQKNEFESYAPKPSEDQGGEYVGKNTSENPITPAPKQETIALNNPRPTTRDLLYGEFKNTPPPPEVEVFNTVGAIRSDPIEIVPENPIEDPEKKTIFLPPSFVKADLLTGITARTTGTSSKDTTPLMLRIRDLAILPNSLKADLKGCFVIAEGYGDLASERIITRLVTLSCVDKKGGAVIDESVDGFIVDEDGGIGLAANVTAKMGTHIARSMWAGFVGGFGKGLSDSQREFSFSDSGNVNSLIDSQDLNKSVKSGLGEGISDATKDLRSFYLKLAEQTMPVLQSGSSKEVTIVFSKGKDLSIMAKDLY